MHSAINIGDVKKINALVKLGASFSKTTIIEAGEGTLSNVTAINCAIFHLKPEVLATLLYSRKSLNAMGIKCRDAKGTLLSSVELVLKMVRQTMDENAKLVRIMNSLIDSIFGI